jgi:ADP-heptose:LPS heptosyltransferase
MHEVERGLDLVGAIGLGTEERELALRVPEEARAAVATTLRDVGVTGERPLIVIHPGCSMPARTYPWESFVATAELAVERLGAMIAFTGALDEQDLVARIHDRLSPRARAAAHPLAGQLPFPEFCALIERADLTITNNTGPMHVAAAVGTPVVALFALTNPPEQWGPWRVPHRLLNHDVPCRLCYSRACPYGHECLTLVTPEMVVSAAEELLGGEEQTKDEVRATKYEVMPTLSSLRTS